MSLWQSLRIVEEVRLHHIKVTNVLVVHCHGSVTSPLEY